MRRLEGKVAFITASGGAIAGATARLFGAEGAAVCCVDIVEENVNQAATDINDASGKAIAITCDVTDDDAVRAAVEKTVAEFGKVGQRCRLVASGSDSGDITMLRTLPAEGGRP